MDNKYYHVEKLKKEEDMEENQKPKGLSIAGMVLGIVGLVFSIIPCTWWLGGIICIIGLIISIVAMNGVKKGTADGKGMAITGIICGIIGIIIPLLYLTLFASIIGGAAALSNGVSM